jgi:hypothetical protein
MVPETVVVARPFERRSFAHPATLMPELSVSPRGPQVRRMWRRRMLRKFSSVRMSTSRAESQSVAQASSESKATKGCVCIYAELP